VSTSQPEQLAKAERLRRGHHARFLRARIEELPFDDGSVDAVIPNGVVNFSADKRRGFADAARLLPPGGRLALADIVTERQIATPTARQAELWAAWIAGASHVDLYLENIGSRRPPPASGPDQSRLPIRERTSAAHKPQVRGAQRVALKPASGYTNPTTTGEISK
jgi:SAM-dependent methyltransferase